MLLKRNASRKIFPSSKALPPDQKSLDMIVLRATYVAHYVPLDPSRFGWALVDDTWKPVWFEGNALPEVNKTVDSPENESSEDEKDMIETKLMRTAKSVMTVILWSHLKTTI